MLSIWNLWWCVTMRTDVWGRGGKEKGGGWRRRGGTQSKERITNGMWGINVWGRTMISSMTEYFAVNVNSLSQFRWLDIMPVSLPQPLVISLQVKDSVTVYTATTAATASTKSVTATITTTTETKKIKSTKQERKNKAGFDFLLSNPSKKIDLYLSMI